MDLSKLSDADLLALKGGDLSKISDDGLMSLKGVSAPKAERKPIGFFDALKSQRFKDEVMTSLPGGIARGLKDVVDTGAWALAKGADFFSGGDNAAQVDAQNKAGKTDFARAQEAAGAGVSDVGRIAGNVIATLPVGGALGAGAAKLGMNRLGSSLASGGFTTAGKVAPGALNAASNMGVRMAGGAGTGLASSALVDPESALAGAVVGGLLPPVVAGAGKAGQSLAPILFKKSADNAALRTIAGQLGDDAQQAIVDMNLHFPKGAENIPVSAAAAAKNMKLAQLEQGSRIKAAPAWAEFDQTQGKAVFDNVMLATKEAEELAARKAARSQNWADAWSKASGSVKPKLWEGRMTQFFDDLSAAKQAPESSNPAVKAVLDGVQGEIDRLGPSFNVGHLQQLRANLSGKANQMSPNPFASAPRDNPAIISIMKEMDDILNVTTGGKWQNVVSGYAKDSGKVGEAKAAQLIRNSFIDQATGRIQGGRSLDAAGDIPIITRAGLNRSMNAARMPDKSLALSPEAEQRLSATLGALDAQGIVQSIKKAATSGGGSDTASNFQAIGQAASNTPSWLVQALNLGRRMAKGKEDDAMAMFLSNPDSLAAALEKYMIQAPSQRGIGAFKAAPALTAGAISGD